MLPSQPLLNLAAQLFRLLPKNLLSYLTGALARRRWPGPMSAWVCGVFARTFGIDLREAELPLAAYRSIEDLFTRRLKPGIRPLAPPVASPADGYLARSAPADQDTAVQAKGLVYSLADLVFGEGRERPSNLGIAWYQTIYLAPHNYHRVHAPAAGLVTTLRYIPGQLWPVNVPFVARIPRLFNRNERLIFDLTLATGGRAWVVMVGAFNVGRMTTPLAPSLVTNGAGRQLGARPIELALGRPVALGDELGTFMLGSTVVLVYDRQALAGLAPRRVFQAEGNGPILMGQPLTRGDRHD